MKIFFYITGLALAGLVFADPKPVSWLELAETVRPSTSGESAPQIAAAGEGTFPGETLILTGDGLEDATLIIRTADREVALAPLHSASDRMLAVLPDALPRAALVVWPVRGGQVGAPIRVNAPQVWWHWPLRVTTQTDKLHLMGRNFKLPDGGTAVYMEGGGFEGIVPVTESDPYHLCVRLPGGLTAGDCQLYVWNGTDWGWSDPLTVSIEAEQAAPSAATLIAGDYGAHPNDDTDDAAALQAALDALAPGGTLVLARGRYLLSRSLVVTTPNVSIKGAGAGAYDAAAVTINGAATHLKYADVYQLPASLIEICAAGCEVSALAAENGNNGEDQTVISVHAPDARIHDVTLVSHDKRNWGYAEPGPNFGTPKNNPNPLTTKVVDSGALFVETVGRADLWFYDSAVHAVGPGVLIGTLQAVSTSLNPAPCAPSSDGVRVEGVRFTGYYAGEPNNQPNTGGSGRAVGVIIYNGKKLAVRNCQFESAARTARKIMCRTVLALNTSTRDLYLAENRSLNVGSHTSATGMDPNQGESYLFHYHYPYGGLFNVAQAGPDSVTPVLSGIPPVPGQPGDPHYNDPHYFTDNAGSRVLPEVGANDHWLVFICAGKGVGQYRQVTAQTDEGGLIKLTLDRPWRVVPDTASRFNLTPAYRQIVLYKNYVDTGGSTNLRNQHKANGVLFWFYAFDNVVEGNTFKATTSGILFNSRFRSPTAWNLTRGNTVSDVMGRSQDTTAVSPAGYVDHVRITQGWPAPEDRVFYSVGNAARENYFDVGNGAATKYYGVGAYLHAVFTGNVNAGLPPVEHATGGIVMSVIENNVFTGLLEEGVSVETPANTCLVRRNQIKLPNETPAEKAVVVAPEISGLNMVVENNEAVPEITRSPLSQSAPLGTRIKLTVSAAGGDNFQYQWMKDGAILDGATSASLLLEGTPADAGSYRCLVTGAGAGVWSEPAEITISPAPGGPLSAPVAVAVDASGALYIADAARHDIQSVGAANTLALLAGVSGSAGLADGAGAGAMFDTPSALAVRSGTLFVSDAENARVRTVSAAGRVGSLAASGFVTPAGIAADDRGNLYVADKGAHVIRKLDGATGAPAIVAGQTGAPGFANGAGMLARFAAPEGVAWKPSGAGAGVLYVADTENHVVREIDLDAGAEVSTLAGVAGDAGCADGQGAGARFNLPGGIIVDGAGTLFLADTGNSVIREISPSGMVLTLAGNPGADGIAGIPGFKDGAGLGALFNRPSALALSPDGEFLYVADTGNRAIRKIDANDNVSTLALVAAPDATPPGADGGTGGNGGGGAFSRWFLAVLFFSMMLRHALNKQTPI